MRSAGPGPSPAVALGAGASTLDVPGHSLAYPSPSTRPGSVQTPDEASHYPASQVSDASEVAAPHEKGKQLERQLASVVSQRPAKWPADKDPILDAPQPDHKGSLDMTMYLGQSHWMNAAIIVRARQPYNPLHRSRLTAHLGARSLASSAR